MNIDTIGPPKINLTYIRKHNIETFTKLSSYHTKSSIDHNYSQIYHKIYNDWNYDEITGRSTSTSGRDSDYEHRKSLLQEHNSMEKQGASFSKPENHFIGQYLENYSFSVET